MGDSSSGRPDIVTTVEEIHREVDEAASLLFALHRDRLHCAQGCTRCCVDGISVFAVEAELIRAHHGGLIGRGTPHPEGACAFLDETGACRIYSHRPYVCRTQGLPLRWLDEAAGGGIVEMRDICPVNEQGQAVETLEKEQCWTIGPFELRLAALQALFSGAGMDRVPLRSLFGEASAEAPGPEPCPLELDIEIGPCAPGDGPEVMVLLGRAGLCTTDITPEKLGHFLAARTGEGDIIGVVGCETFGEHGLLRSLAVRGAYRGAGLGTALAQAMEAQTRSEGVRTLYLLTVTVPGFFLRLGFTTLDRSLVPASISGTEEFQGLCPATAVCLAKRLD
jgi:N-acetylglutamate synthase-like GNAT family acetyltransferase